MKLFDIMVNMKNENINLLLLIFTAFIWGNAFVAQSVGADYVGPFTFLALRSWLGAAVLLPLLYKNRDKINKRAIKGGAICGLFLFLASLFQQIGIAHTTTAKSGFITALYMVIVPILYLIMGKKVTKKIWLSVLLAIIGLSLLCLKGSLVLQYGDLITLLCALGFSLQIISVDHYASSCDAFILSEFQFIVCAILSSLFIPFEHTSLQAIQNASIAILYAGIFSTGVGYTLQTVGQKGLNPTIASIAMCLESVFSALAGWFWLHQSLTFREILGCIIMFGAIILTQIPDKQEAS